MVESTRLESERTGNRTVGSNPTLSAILSKTPISLRTIGTCVLPVYFYVANFAPKGLLDTVENAQQFHDEIRRRGLTHLSFENIKAHGLQHSGVFN